MELSPHFSLEELTHSDTATERGIDNTPSPEILANLTKLAGFLEEVRAALGNHPIQITSGYRCPELNAAVDGVSNSQHMSGLAADIECPEVGNPMTICQRLQGTPGLAYDQLINESNSAGGHWTHISTAAYGAEPRGEVWTISPAGTRKGL